MQVFFFAALAFALVAVMFALQNIVPVRVAFLAWTFEGSLALVLFVALMTGALVSFLVSIPPIVRGRWAAKSLKKQITSLEAELASTRQNQDAARPPTPRAGGASGGASGDDPAAGLISSAR